MLEPLEPADLVNTNNMVQEYLPRQTDIDKILKIIQRKVLKGTHFPVTIKEIQAGYINSPYFKDLKIRTLHKANYQVQRAQYRKFMY